VSIIQAYGDVNVLFCLLQNLDFDLILLEVVFDFVDVYGAQPRYQLVVR
jgi:hypothetical protein